MFSTLPPHERQAFMSLMDEYYSSRPHLLPAGSSGATAPPAATGASAGNPYASGPAPPPARSGPSVAQAQTALAGLQMGKSLGKLNTTSASAAFGSLMGKQPATTAAAAAAAPPPIAPRGAALPPPARAADAALGKAVVIYAYNGGEAEDLSVAEGEEVTLLERVSEDWWKARGARGQEGIVPATYIRQL